jgi:predicted ATPase with chaperone activity
MVSISSISFIVSPRHILRDVGICGNYRVTFRFWVDCGEERDGHERIQWSRERLNTLSKSADCEYPQPCGFYGDPVWECTCSAGQVRRYQQRLSGPLLDRIDIHIDVPRVDYDKLTDDRRGEPSAAIRERVEVGRERQRARFRDEPRLQANADMGPTEIRHYCQPSPEGQRLLNTTLRQMQLSARAYHRILKLSRTIADLAGSDTIEITHLAEAIQYRPRKLVY